jgi:hypothetical protein
LGNIDDLATSRGLRCIGSIDVKTLRGDRRQTFSGLCNLCSRVWGGRSSQSFASNHARLQLQVGVDCGNHRIRQLTSRGGCDGVTRARQRGIDRGNLFCSGVSGRCGGKESDASEEGKGTAIKPLT